MFRSIQVTKPVGQGSCHDGAGFLFRVCGPGLLAGMEAGLIRGIIRCHNLRLSRRIASSRHTLQIINDGDYVMNKDNDEQRPSKQRKQQQKREAEAAQALGTTLVELPAAQFNRLIDKLELPDTLREALLLCRSMKAREGRRRQVQYIGKLMRGIDAAPVQQMLTEIERGGQVATAQLHKIERWRERLLAEGDAALQELLRLHPAADAAHLQQLIASAHKESSQQQAPRAARMLFKYLRDLLQD